MCIGAKYTLDYQLEAQAALRNSSPIIGGSCYLLLLDIFSRRMEHHLYSEQFGVLWFVVCDYRATNRHHPVIRRMDTPRQETRIA